MQPESGTDSQEPSASIAARAGPDRVGYPPTLHPSRASISAIGSHSGASARREKGLDKICAALALDSVTRSRSALRRDSEGPGAHLSTSLDVTKREVSRSPVQAALPERRELTMLQREMATLTRLRFPTL